MIVIGGELHSSKNSRRILRNRKTGAPFVAKSTSAKADEQSFETQLAAQREEWDATKLFADLARPLRVVFRLRRATRRRFDYLNIIQGLCDAMVKAGYIVDDDADHLLPVFEPYVLDRDNPGCEFWVELH